MAKISTLRRKEKIELEVEDDVFVTYEMREMSGLEGAEYKNLLKSKVTTRADGVTTVLDFKGMYSDLISRCLFTADGKPVPQATIDAWPEGAQEELFKIAQSVNRLVSEDDEDNEKKD